MLVLHYTGMESAAAALARLCDAASKVSAHYLITEEGAVHLLVQDDKRAWHAGVASWRGITQVNHSSVGIELANPGHQYGYRHFPDAQMEALAALCTDLLSRHAIPLRNVIAHSDVAPQRKEDPGELFNWQWLAEKGIGLWPTVSDAEDMLGHIAGVLKEGEKGGGVKIMQQNLFDYGYAVPLHGEFDEATKKVVIAFQRHFRAEDISGVWDGDCAARLSALLGMVD
jgi:N-acetylmuramoyl-L-alanine amidase